MPQLFLSIYQEKVSSDAREGIARESEGKKAKSKNFLLPCPSSRLPLEGMAMVFSVSSYFKLFDHEKSPQGFS